MTQLTRQEIRARVTQIKNIFQDVGKTESELTDAEIEYGDCDDSQVLDDLNKLQSEFSDKLDSFVLSQEIETSSLMILQAEFIALNDSFKEWKDKVHMFFESLTPSLLNFALRKRGKWVDGK